MEKLDLITQHSERTLDLAGREILVLRHSRAVQLAGKTGKSIHLIYREALEQGIYPFRYVRNRGIISPEEQLTLCRSIVAVVGAGGLGGHIILLLARLGIGSLVIIDSDSFDESNLNRQALCTEASIGKPKALEAARQVAEVNSGTLVSAHSVRFNKENAPELLKGCSLVIDALDTVRDRFILQQEAKKAGIPLVHGAIAGFEGQVMTVFPEDKGISLIYGDYRDISERGKGPEAELGVPAVTASLVANLQVMEALKIILKRGSPVRNTMLHADLLTAQVQRLSF